jgi:hypothetical protein
MPGKNIDEKNYLDDGIERGGGEREREKGIDEKYGWMDEKRVGNVGRKG